MATIHRTPVRKFRRKVRKFVKRRGKGRGQTYGQGGFAQRANRSFRVRGRGFGGRYYRQTDITEDDVSAFFGGKGAPPTSGKGFGRRGNPRGKDGKPLKCHNCGSEDHFQKDCPKGTGKGHMLTLPQPSNISNNQNQLTNA